MGDGDDDDRIFDVLEEHDVWEASEHSTAIGPICAPNRERKRRRRDGVERCIHARHELRAETRSSRFIPLRGSSSIRAG